MVDADGPDDPDFEDTSVQLNEGLRNCRAVMSGYRALLAGDGRGETDPAGFTESGDADEANVG